MRLAKREGRIDQEWGVTGARRECSWTCELGWMVKKCHQEGAGGLGYCGGLQRLAVSVKLKIIIGRNEDV